MQYRKTKKQIKLEEQKKAAERRLEREIAKRKEVEEFKVKYRENPYIAMREYILSSITDVYDMLRVATNLIELEKVFHEKNSNILKNQKGSKQNE